MADDLNELGDLEQAIIDQLMVEIADLPVESYPIVISDHYFLRNPRGAVLVIMGDERYAVGSSGVQQCLVTVVITLLVRNLSSHRQIYQYRRQVRSLLMGYQPAGWQPLRAVAVKVIPKDPSDGVWQVDMTFETFNLAVSQFDLCPLNLA